MHITDKNDQYMLKVGKMCNPHQRKSNALGKHMVGCFGLNGPLRQDFSLYRAVSQREGERKEK